LARTDSAGPGRGAARLDAFSARLLAWAARHGRKTLPWQRSRDPYRVWVSEIMLQQTQVTTVIPYYERFLRRFPDVATLARARIDSVLHLWTGLGYYARARNLQRAARMIMREHAGKFPRAFDAVAALPGIGRSTAGAILALAFGQRHAILDGNVKRVLARYHAIERPLADRPALDQLWHLAERHTPPRRVAAYTQAIMDLGATICTPRKPQCGACPLARGCRARRIGAPEDYPATARRARRPERAVAMLMLRDARGRVLLTRRPPAGLWGGLWTLPEFALQHDVARACRERFGLRIRREKAWPPLRHDFSHFRLAITPIPARVVGPARRMMEHEPAVWYNPGSPDARGLAAPVKRLIEQLQLEDR